VYGTFPANIFLPANKITPSVFQGGMNGTICPADRIHACSYTELVVSSPAAAETIASIHCAYSQRDGQARWVYMAWINTATLDVKQGHQSQY